jgi:hypothetical protein
MADSDERVRVVEEDLEVAKRALNEVSEPMKI